VILASVDISARFRQLALQAIQPPFTTLLLYGVIVPFHNNPTSLSSMRYKLMLFGACL
jgi:hypothetical protein